MDTTIVKAIKNLESEEVLPNELTDNWESIVRNMKLSTSKRLLSVIILTIFLIIAGIYVCARQNNITVIVVYMVSLVSVMILIWWLLLIKLTARPMELLLSEIRNLEDKNYLDLHKFNINRETLFLAFEFNKILLRANQTEDILNKTKQNNETLKEFLICENVSRRISNTFMEFTDFDSYVSKLIAIICDFLDEYSKSYRVRIGFFASKKNQIDFKYQNYSLSDNIKNSNCELIYLIINEAKFPQEMLNNTVISPIFCENTGIYEDYKSFEKNGVKSLAIAPIYIQKKYQAILCLEIFDEHISWNSSKIFNSVIGAACSGIVYAAMRKKNEKEKEEALIKAEMNEKIKSEFLSTISNEIKTPINEIAELTNNHIKRKDVENNLYRDIERILRNANILQDSVNRIFDFIKLQQNKLEIIPKKYYLYSFVKNICNTNFKHTKNRNVDFILNIDENLPSAMFGDSERIEQILNGLLSNAIKFTDNGNITLIIKEKERTGSHISVYFAVKDTGIGTDGSYSRKHDGTRIDISIAREFVNLMGGKISISSKIDSGSKFSFVITQEIIDAAPIGKLSTKDFYKPEEDDGSKNNFNISYMPYGKVLIVDDVKTNIDVAKGLMLPYGLDVDYVLSGKDAIKKIESKQKIYDLVFMDHMMPDMDGIETVDYIRKKIDSDYARNLPIIAFTANVTISKNIFYENGFNGYITKPVDKLDLNNLLTKYIHDNKKEKKITAETNEKNPVKSIESNFVSEQLKSAKINGLNIEAALNNFGGNTEVYINVLNSFLNNVIPLLQKIESVKKEALPEYAVSIHGLKGSCYGIGAIICGDLAKELEISAKNGDFRQVLDNSKTFIQNINELIGNIENLLAEIKSTKEKNDNREERDKLSENLLKELLEAVSRYDSDKMNEIIDELDKFRYKKDKELMKYLKECATNYQYDKIESKIVAALLE